MGPPTAAIRAANRDDNQALLELIFRSPQGGRFLLGSDRSPDFFARSAPYDESRVSIAEDDAGIAGTVSCALKSVLVQGQVQRAAYIFDLAVDERARRQGWAKRLLAEAEAWSRGQAADFLYAHVMGGNRAALSTFAGAGYGRIAPLASRLFPMPASERAPAGKIRAVEEGDWPALSLLVQGEFQDHDLLRAESAQGLRALWEKLPGYRAEEVWASGQPPKAVLGVWDYSAISRAVPLRLPAEMGALQGPSPTLRRAGPSPVPLLALGQPLRYGLLLGAAGHPEALDALFLHATAQARGLGLDALLLFHDSRTPPAWLPSRSLDGVYHLLAKPLRSGPAAALGERPLWVDPVDL